MPATVTSHFNTNTNMITTPTDFEDLLKRIVASFTNHAQHISIETVPVGQEGLRFVLRVHRAEFGKVVGKQGKRINAIKLLFAAMGAHNEMPLRITLDDPKVGERATEPTTADNNWSTAEAQSLLDDILRNLCSQYEVAPIDTAGATTFEIVLLDKALPVEITEAMQAVFNAIGRSHNRVVELDFV